VGGETCTLRRACRRAARFLVDTAGWRGFSAQHVVTLVSEMFGVSCDEARDGIRAEVEAMGLTWHGLEGADAAERRYRAVSPSDGKVTHACGENGSGTR
jgi:hypothetical protein